LKPNFGDVFTIEIMDAGEVLSMRVWDQDLTTSDAVGFAKIKVSSLMLNRGIQDWFEISYDNKPAGKILLSSEFEPKDGKEYEDQKKELKAKNALLATKAEMTKQVFKKMANNKDKLHQSLAKNIWGK
jgi:hypothetical protein